MRVPGFCRAGSIYTNLADGVIGVTRVECQGLVMVRVLAPYMVEFLKYFSEGRGRPTHYAVVRGKLYLYPVPDAAYRLDVSWDGEKRAEEDDAFFAPNGWLAMYFSERAALLTSLGRSADIAWVGDSL